MKCYNGGPTRAGQLLLLLVGCVEGFSGWCPVTQRDLALRSPPDHFQQFAVAASTTDEVSTSSATEETSTHVAAITSRTGTGEEKLEFPAPLTRSEQLLRAATFWATAVPLVFSYYGKAAEIQLRQQLLAEPLSEEDRDLIWREQHVKGARKLADTITSLSGFYVKTAQIIASRQDLFPKEYTDALQGFTDNLDPLDTNIIKTVISNELLLRDETFEDMFVEFDDIPLGSASIAQVHRAVLTEKYGGKEVAVKVQRPAIEPKLLGDIANLKAITKSFQEALPLDYYTVFCELEKQLADEFDFVAEAVSMDRIYQTVTDNGTKAAPLVIPRPMPGLVTRRVLVMDYLPGVPLSRAREEMLSRGIDPDSPEAKLFGRKLLKSLTKVFGKCILSTGFFHADPHPGNIFVLEDGDIGLIDFGQVKQISGRRRETLAKVMVALDERQSDDNPEDLERIGNLALELGVEINADAKPEAAAAIAMWLFDGTVENLPGGYEKGELSPNSPLKELKSFPQDLVLVGRSTILIKGLSSRLGIPWSLCQEWAPEARKVLNPTTANGGSTINSAENIAAGGGRVRFSQVLSSLKQWGSGKATAVIKHLPSPARTMLLAKIVKRKERQEQKQMLERKKRRQ
jgi:aarF domain-containing kinase